MGNQFVPKASLGKEKVTLCLDEIGSEYYIIMGKTLSPLFAVVIDPIFIILEGNKGMHKSLYKIAFQPDPTTYY